MDPISEVMDNIGDTFKGIFKGGGTMSTGAKWAVGIIVVILILALVYLVYHFVTTKGFSRKNVGPSGCCGKLQNPRVMEIEAQLSDQDLREGSQMYAASGMPLIRDYYKFDSYDNVQGFSSPSAKPSADDFAGSEQMMGNQPIVRQQVPYNRNMRPAYEEPDFVNMAYQP
jgi:hypothetical protein